MFSMSKVDASHQRMRDDRAPWLVSIWTGVQTVCPQSRAIYREVLQARAVVDDFGDLVVVPNSEQRSWA